MSKQVFFTDPALDRLMGTVLALAAELHVTRCELATLRAALLDQGLLDAAGCEQLAAAEPGPEQVAELSRYVHELFGPLLADAPGPGSHGND